MDNVEVDLEDDSRVLGTLRWSSRGIVVLP